MRYLWVIGIVCAEFEHQPLIFEINCHLPRSSLAGPAAIRLWVPLLSEGLAQERTILKVLVKVPTLKRWKKQSSKDSQSTYKEVKALPVSTPCSPNGLDPGHSEGTEPLESERTTLHEDVRGDGAWTELTAEDWVSHRRPSTLSSQYRTAFPTASLKAPSTKSLYSFTASCRKQRWHLTIAEGQGRRRLPTTADVAKCHTRQVITTMTITAVIMARVHWVPFRVSHCLNMVSLPLVGSRAGVPHRGHMPYVANLKIIHQAKHLNSLISYWTSIPSWERKRLQGWASGILRLLNIMCGNVEPRKRQPQGPPPLPTHSLPGSQVCTWRHPRAPPTLPLQPYWLLPSGHPEAQGVVSLQEDRRKREAPQALQVDMRTCGQGPVFWCSCSRRGRRYWERGLGGWSTSLPPLRPPHTPRFVGKTLEWGEPERVFWSLKPMVGTVCLVLRHTGFKYIISFKILLLLQSHKSLLLLSSYRRGNRLKVLRNLPTGDGIWPGQACPQSLPQIGVTPLKTLIQIYSCFSGRKDLSMSGLIQTSSV